MPRPLLKTGRSFERSATIDERDATTTALAAGHVCLQTISSLDPSCREGDLHVRAQFVYGATFIELSSKLARLL